MANKRCLAISILIIISSMASPTLSSTISPYTVDFDLHNMAGFDDNTISSEDIVAFIQEKYPDSPMLSDEDIGSCFISAGQTNNVNPAFLVATACLEGGFGTLGWAQSYPECHNTFGYGIPSGATQPDDYNCMDSWCAMVQRAASVIAHGTNYYAQGLNTVSQVRAKYAASPNAASIAGLMNELYAFSVNFDEDSSPKQENVSLQIVQQSPGSSVVVMLNTGYVYDTILEEGGNLSMTSLAFSPDGNKLAAYAEHSYPSIWDVSSETKLQTLKTDPMGGKVLAFSPDGSKLADGAERIYILDVASGEMLQSMQGSGTFLAAFSPDSSKLTTIDKCGTASIWDVKRGTELKNANYGESDLSSIAISPDSSKLAACSRADRTTRVWDVESGTKLQELEHDHPVSFVALNLDGSKLATKCVSEGELDIWDVKSGTKLQEFNLDEDYPLAFSPDGNKLATGSSDGQTGKIWDVESRTILQTLEGHIPADNYWGKKAVTFSLDGSKLAIGGSDGYTRIWNVGEIVTISANKKGVTEELPSLVVAPLTEQNTTASEEASGSNKKSPGIGGILAIAALLCIFILWKKD